MARYIAFDIGAESGRGIIGRFDGKKIALREIYRFGHTPLQFRSTLRWDVLMMAQQQVLHGMITVVTIIMQHKLQLPISLCT